jgi:transposase
MWDPTSRRQHSRAALRYGSDLTDAEWVILEPLLPPPCPCGRKRKWPMRRIVEAILFIMRAGCAWDMLPDGFPPVETVYRWFARFRDDGTWERINHHLVMQDRERVGRAASPTAAVIDSQSAKTAEAGGPRGYDAGKKVKGRKRRVSRTHRQKGRCGAVREMRVGPSRSAVRCRPQTAASCGRQERPW